MKIRFEITIEEVIESELDPSEPRTNKFYYDLVSDINPIGARTIKVAASMFDVEEVIPDYIENQMLVVCKKKCYSSEEYERLVFAATEQGWKQ